jgi:pimeloyl-ACP methyl ester carboxylesterase
VYPVTLPGIGTRRGEATRETDLDMYIDDVVALLEREQLADAVLVGHSYSGIVVTGVADRVATQLGALVYLDSAPFEDGKAYVDVLGPEEREAIERSVQEQGDRWLLPPPDLTALGGSTSGLDGRMLADVHNSMTPQPFATWTQRLRLSGANGDYRQIAIACNNMRELVGMGIPRMVALTREPWEWIEIETSHWPMASAPRELAEALDGISR